MPIYEVLSRHNYATPASIPVTAADTVGARFMALCLSQDLVWPGNAPRIVELFNNLMLGRWQWFPPMGPSNGSGLLDSAILTGSSGQFADAFATLLRSPAPHGFGTRAVTLEHRAGTHGFLARHTGTHFTLNPNVLYSDWDVESPPLMPFHYKQSHTVVESDGVYYDPCYGQFYYDLEEMEAYHVTLEDDGGEDGVPTATVTSPKDDRSFAFDLVVEGSAAHAAHPHARFIASEEFAKAVS